jgi:hypothetical protein
MSLHDTTEIAKKVGIVLALLFGLFIVVTVFLKAGAFIHAILFPPKIAPANEAYGKIPPIAFPKSSIPNEFTYSINTVNGSLPQDFPDRLIVYPMIINQPNLLDLKNAQQNISNLNFMDQSGNPLPAIPLGGPTYEWKETVPEQSGFLRTLDYNTVTQNFTMNSNYLSQLSVLQAQAVQAFTSPTDAINPVQNFLTNLAATTSDIDFSLTQSPTTSESYTTTPLLYSVSNGQLTQTTALASAQVVRVDLYQKALSYSITASIDQDLTHSQSFDMQLPIIYPHPPYSTMNFLVASGQDGADVVTANYNHQTINTQPSQTATYPIKNAQQAFDDLKSGKGYIASYNGTGNQILINNVFLAYFISDSQQNYLMPVIVFQGQDGFFSYVSAVMDSALQ